MSLICIGVVLLVILCFAFGLFLGKRGVLDK